MHETYLSCCFTQECPALSDPSGSRLMPTLFIYHKSAAYPGAKWIPIPSLRLLFAKLGGFHEYRRSPRPLSYMKELIHSRIGKIDCLGMMETSTISQVDVSKFKQIILLWPDANGMGWFNIERRIFK